MAGERPLWQLWLLALAASVAADLVLRWLALRVFGVSPRFFPRASGGAEVVAFTLFGVVRRWAARPTAAFRKITDQPARIVARRRKEGLTI